MNNKINKRYIFILKLCFLYFFSFNSTFIYAENLEDKNKEKNISTPYDKDLLQLSAFLGSLSYLEEICSQPSLHSKPDRWKNLMISLIREENFDQKRTERFFESYNHAYKGYSQNYHHCTEMALQAQLFYKNKIINLAKNLLAHYGT